MTLCQATCAHGGACSYKAKLGQLYCGKHLTTENMADVIPCGKMMTNGAACAKAREHGAAMCPFHTRVETERRVREAGRIVWAETLDMLWADRNGTRAVNYLIQAFTNHTLTEALFAQYAAVLEGEINFMNNTYPPPAELKGDLHALALDSQNVHTGAVNTQTDEGLELLLKTHVPESQVTMDELAVAWAGKPMFRPVLQDVYKWYKTSACRTTGDMLYRRALDGLWARAKTKPEVVQRLWEECVDARGMCCEGHISRLCNVLVGFDDAFKPAVSLGELLQQKMAAIAAKDAASHLKVGEAWAVFEELAIPMEQRMAWMEAF
jgi:hypothetical protein